MTFKSPFQPKPFYDSMILQSAYAGHFFVHSLLAARPGRLQKMVSQKASEVAWLCHRGHTCPTAVQHAEGWRAENTWMLLQGKQEFSPCSFPCLRVLLLMCPLWFWFRLHQRTQPPPACHGGAHGKERERVGGWLYRRRWSSSSHQGFGLGAHQLLLPAHARAEEGKREQDGYQ